MLLLAGRSWHALTNRPSEGKFQLNKANCEEHYINLSTRTLDFMRSSACYVINKMPSELRYERTDAATSSSLAQKCWELLRPFCFKLCAATPNNTQQHATTCDRVCKRTQHVHPTTLGVVANNFASVCTGL